MGERRTYLELAFHCPELPEMDPAQRSAWCKRCSRKVHNLSAMSAEEQEQLLRDRPDSCVSYRRVIPVVVAVAMSVAGAPDSALAQDSDDEDATELTTVTITGGIPRRVSPLFQPSQLPEPDSHTDTQEGGS